MLKIDEILSLLDNFRPEADRIKGVILAGQVKCLKPFVRPLFSYQNCSSHWDYCALVLARRSDTELYPYMAELFDWAAYYNDAGAAVIYDRLVLMERNAAFFEVIQKVRKEPAVIQDKSILNLVDEIESGKGTRYPDDFDVEVNKDNPVYNRRVDGMDEPCDIDIALEMLRDSNSPEIQEKGRDIARKIQYSRSFEDVFYRTENGSAAFNLASVLCERSDAALEYGELLIPWVKDMSRPYAKVCFDRLLKVRHNSSLDYFILGIPEENNISKDYPELAPLRKLRTPKEGKDMARYLFTVFDGSYNRMISDKCFDKYLSYRISPDEEREWGLHIISCLVEDIPYYLHDEYYAMSMTRRLLDVHVPEDDIVAAFLRENGGLLYRAVEKNLNKLSAEGHAELLKKIEQEMKLKM